MKGVVKSVKLETFDVKKGENKGKKFSKIVISCDVTDEKNDVVTLKASLTPDYAKKYFGYCKVSSRELVGKEVDVVVSRRSFKDDEGIEKTFRYIKFVNCLDENGKPIIMPKEDSDKVEEIF